MSTSAEKIVAPTPLSAAQLHYSMIIEWDPRDNIYVVTVPELSGCRTHGSTYEEAIAQAQEMIEGWAETFVAAGEALPAPRQYQDRLTFEQP